MRKYLLLLAISVAGLLLYLTNTPVSKASTIFQESMSGTSGQNWAPADLTHPSGDSPAVYNAQGVIGTSHSSTYVSTSISSSDTIVKWTMNLNGNPSGIVDCRMTADDQYEQRAVFNGDGTVAINAWPNGSSSNQSMDASTGTHNFELDCIGNTVTLKEDGNTLVTANPSWDGTSNTGEQNSEFRMIMQDTTSTYTALKLCDGNGCQNPATIGVSPSTSTVTVGTPFNVTLAVNGGGTAFNAAQAHVAVSSNLSITGIHSAPSPACNFQDTQTPTTNDLSFAGAIYGFSSTNCNVYTLTLTPNAAGTGTITITNGSIKSYADNTEILTGVTNGSYAINAANATPTPTPPLSGLAVTSPTETYNSTYTLTGTKDASTTTVFVNGSSTGVTYPTSTTWQAAETLTLGANNTAGSNTFTIYGTDGNGNQTPTISTTVSLHELGDINGDGYIDLTDASLFAVDWEKTSNLTYLLSDMNGDGNVDLTDLSILAKLMSQ